MMGQKHHQEKTLIGYVQHIFPSCSKQCLSHEKAIPRWLRLCWKTDSHLLVMFAGRRLLSFQSNTGSPKSVISQVRSKSGNGPLTFSDFKQRGYKQHSPEDVLNPAWRKNTSTKGVTQTKFKEGPSLIPEESWACNQNIANSGPLYNSFSNFNPVRYQLCVS